jgi:cytidyltransferase-like protein
MSKILDDTNFSSIPKDGVVLVGGCFDIIHVAHQKFLRLSKEQGKFLVVLLESDENIKKLKGKDRPVNNQITRAENLSKIESVDCIILLKTPTSSNYYENIVKSIRPDIIAVTKGDPLLSVKKLQADEVNGKVVIVMERNKEFSSTRIIEN